MSDNGITPIVMPKWGLEMREGIVHDWLVSEGARVEVGQPLVDVETDKISNAVEATDAGLLRRIIAQAGDVLPVQALLAVLAEEDTRLVVEGEVPRAEFVRAAVAAGMELTDSFAMLPTAAVSGYYFSHPRSQYFVVGRVSKEQVADYARRKGVELAQAERWLASNLDYDPE